MKIKHIFLGLILALVSVNSFAQHRGYGYHPHNHYAYHGHYYGRSVWYPNYGWVVPAIIGGAVVYEMTRPVAPQIIIQQPIVQPAPVIMQNSMPVAPDGFHWESMYDSRCNCYKLVAVPN